MLAWIYWFGLEEFADKHYAYQFGPYLLLYILTIVMKKVFEDKNKHESTDLTKLPSLV